MQLFPVNINILLYSRDSFQTGPTTTRTHQFSDI